jgi:hypothetical protein
MLANDLTEINLCNGYGIGHSDLSCEAATVVDNFIWAFYEAYVSLGYIR